MDPGKQKGEKGMEGKKLVSDLPVWLLEIQITRRKREQGFSMENAHSHPDYELFYLISGTCRMFIGHSIYYVTAGDFIFVPPGQSHRTTYESSPVAERVAIGFFEPVIGMMTAMCGEEGVEKVLNASKITIPPKYNACVEELLQKMEEEEKRQDSYSRMMKAGKLLELLVLLGRAGERAGIPESLNETEAAIQEAANYLYSHYQEPLTLKGMAQMAHMSPAYFSKKFHRLTGFGFKEYLTHVRIQAAAEQLLSGKQSVTEVALNCGYSDGNYFGDAFRKIKGMSPNQFRKKNQI